MYPKDYQHLRSLTDKMFDEIQSRHPEEINCTSGCHSCCSPGLTVGNQEKEDIKNFLLQHPVQLSIVKSIQKEDPHQGARCSFLDRNGKCAIYPVRPITCRSHGAPLAIAKQTHFQIDSCPINFKNKPIETLPREDFFILDDLHAWVAFFNQSNARWPLTVDEIMNNEGKS